MEILKSFIEGLRLSLPTVYTLLIVLILIFTIRYILNKKYAGTQGHQFRRQIVTLVLSFIGLLAIIMVLPLNDSSRGQLLGLIGILFSAAIALSSTTLLGNAMAGLMLRSIRSIRPGDFIQVGQHFGRVSEQGLFHIEIQTEDRDLTTMPNLYLVTNPVKVTRSSGTIVSAEVSLGYDMPRRRIEKILINAAVDTGLEEPFVQILSLGDFSVSYRVSGMLQEVKHLLTTQTRLRQQVLDNLHKGRVEIVSPTFMNTRAIPPERQFMPAPASAINTDQESQGSVAPEQIIFDKADQAESLENLKIQHDETNKKIDALKKQRQEIEDQKTNDQLKQKIDHHQSRLKWITELIKRREEEDDTQ